MRSKRLVRYGTAAAAIALLVAGCGSSSSGGKNPNAGPKPKSADNVFNAGTSGIRNVSTTKGGTLNFIADGDCDYWDPARTYYGFCWDMQRLFSRGLMGYAAAPGDAGLNVVPDLATAAGDSPNGKDWTYHLIAASSSRTGPRSRRRTSSTASSGSSPRASSTAARRTSSRSCARAR